VAVLTGRGLVPAPPWSWGLHAGAVVGFWFVAGRITAAGLRGIEGFLRIRRMVPIPVRLTLAAATLNTLLAARLAWSGRGAPGRLPTAYWAMMYLLIAILMGFVFVRGGAARRPTAAAPAGGEER
jgi:hypothetical protein